MNIPRFSDDSLGHTGNVYFARKGTANINFMAVISRDKGTIFPNSEVLKSLYYQKGIRLANYIDVFIQLLYITYFYMDNSLITMLYICIEIECSLA